MLRVLALFACLLVPSAAFAQQALVLDVVDGVGTLDVEINEPTESADGTPLTDLRDCTFTLDLQNDGLPSFGPFTVLSPVPTGGSTTVQEVTVTVAPEAVDTINLVLLDGFCTDLAGHQSIPYSESVDPVTGVARGPFTMPLTVNVVGPADGPPSHPMFNIVIRITIPVPAP